MILLTGTVSLIQLGNLYLAVSLGNTLMVGQSSEVHLSENNEQNIGHFDYETKNLPVYYLNDKLKANTDSSLFKDSQFCVGLKTTEEDNYFVILCNKFEQVDLSDQAYKTQELPSFMCKEKMLVEGMLEYQNQVYLMTTPDKILDYIVGSDIAHEQEGNDV